MAAWLVPLLVAGGLLLVGELRYRAAAEPLQRMPVVPAPAPAPQPLSTQALTLAFGIRPADPSASQLALTLKACFTSSQGESRALVASADGQAIYRVGDELPGGARLRQVDNQSITLWFNGSEQRLSLNDGGQSVLRPVASGEANPPSPLPSPRLLREVP
ncbi:hypothetical protein N5F23_05460 [Pseudomonas sichuanensis]|uniref:type II secretion system protein N n=1 Tax=Pseudomonas sichuanensis TaxID=2213015 RepID=UPI00244CCCB3|nr:type II secretion system protein N [Pseudomonas sichuanensis]MDH0730837.1 hypothetical protein [Pseudomonas sichuanensis]MDH1582038.1 hypothetical protein [Pseudomonas sichuanensis]MDH1594561.1 hypothetical protein [Pseudomonas sichuanensis]MDH1596589.1 hypothetical protein [Pseudomonas sichuanensis]